MDANRVCAKHKNGTVIQECEECHTKMCDVCMLKHMEAHQGEIRTKKYLSLVSAEAKYRHLQGLLAASGNVDGMRKVLDEYAGISAHISGKITEVQNAKKALMEQKATPECNAVVGYDELAKTVKTLLERARATVRELAKGFNPPAKWTDEASQDVNIMELQRKLFEQEAVEHVRTSEMLRQNKAELERTVKRIEDETCSLSKLKAEKVKLAGEVRFVTQTLKSAMAVLRGLNKGAKDEFKRFVNQITKTADKFKLRVSAEKWKHRKALKRHEKEWKELHEELRRDKEQLRETCEKVKKSICILGVFDDCMRKSEEKAKDAEGRIEAAKEEEAKLEKTLANLNAAVKAKAEENRRLDEYTARQVSDITKEADIKILIAKH